MLKRYKGSGAVWDPAKNKIVFQFDPATHTYDTDDENEQRLLEKAGFEGQEITTKTKKPKIVKPKIDPLYNEPIKTKKKVAK